MIMDDTLIKLKTVGAALDYEGYSSKNNDNLLEVRAGAGQAFLMGLYKGSEMAVCRNFASAGSKWPEHYHNEWEMLIVYEGKMNLTIGGDSHILKRKDSYYIREGVAHGASFPTDCWFLSVTIPGAEAFPNE